MDTKEIMKQLEQGVAGVFESDNYKQYLDFMGRFHDYSINNIILIMMQKPEASLVAGYQAWQKKFNRHVKKGEKGINILAPCQHKRTVEDEDGNEQEISWTSFRPVTVFDISQTDGEAVPEYVHALDGKVEGYEELIGKLQKASPVPVSIESIEGSANGYYKLDEKRIVVKAGMSEQQTVKTMVHEISHAILHDKDTGAEKGADNHTMEVQAESVAYTVCRMLGLDTSEYSFGYIAGWSKGKDIKELRNSMEIIRKTANQLVENIAA